MIDLVTLSFLGIALYIAVFYVLVVSRPILDGTSIDPGSLFGYIQTLISSIIQLIVWAYNLILAIIRFVVEYWYLFLLIPLLLFGGFILSVHNKALADSWDTFAITILQPNTGPLSDIIHYLPNLLRVPLAWWNAWIGVSNVLKRAIVETFQSCTITRWGDIATTIGEFALSIVQGLGNWILSRFAV